jgi:acyl-CoA synthetase (AMP-forming)/AMP-acid ligase II
MFNREATLVDLLRSRALSRPDEPPHTFLVDGESREAGNSYRELDRKARAIAAWLQSLKLTGERVLLLYPPGLEYISAFFGCLYAGAIAIPLSPVNSARPTRGVEKLRSIIHNSKPRACLTMARASNRLENLLSQVPDLESLKWSMTDELDEGAAEEWTPPKITDQSLAYLQYTSGSTSDPKGVMITHRNVLDNLEDFRTSVQHTPETSLVSWLPHFHDMGLVYGVLMPIYCGIPGYLMSPASFIQQPMRWLQAISRYGATHTAAPNFAYDFCVANFKPEKCLNLDLGNWRVAINGAEPVRRDTIERFCDTFAPYYFRRETFRPGYGLAEATLVVSVGKETRPPLYCRVRAAELEKHQVVEIDEGEREGNGGGFRSLVGCGAKASRIEVVVVNANSLTRRQPGEVGEIWVAGSSVAQGYWNRPSETEAVFRAHLAETGEGPFLRTGDLGFFKGEELFITGRIKDLIIIDGGNHYPQDIEQTAERSHPAIRAGCCAAFPVEVEGEERLVIVAEIDRHYKSEPDRTGGKPALAVEIVKGIRRAVNEEHELKTHAVALIKSGSIPKTSSGKLQRYACRAAYLTGTLDRWAESSTPIHEN